LIQLAIVENSWKGSLMLTSERPVSDLPKNILGDYTSQGL